jgi:Peptidase family M28
MVIRLLRFLSSFVALFALASLACNASAAPASTLIARPPTALPTPTNTPIPPTPLAFDPQRPLDKTMPNILDNVSQAELLADVNTLVSFKTRHVLSDRDSTTQGIGAAQRWLLAQFTEIQKAHAEKNILVETQPFAFKWRVFDVEAENIILILPGVEAAAGTYVIGAHYDSISSDPFDGQMLAPGAVDNASGVAAMLQIAQIMAAREPRATLIFVAFAAEETGLQGSAAFVEDYLKAKNIGIRGMINIDMIGSEQGPGNETDSRTMRLFSAPPNNSISRLMARTAAYQISLYVTDMVVNVQDAVDRPDRFGDHIPFSEAGFASVRFIQGTENSKRQHSPRDDLDHLTPDYLRRTTRAVLAHVLCIAEGLPPPVGIGLRRDGTAESVGWSPVIGAAGYIVALRAAESVTFDRFIPIGADQPRSMPLTMLGAYDVVAVAALDENGRVGPFSTELSLR